MAALLLPGSAAAVELSSSFDTGLEGWTTFFTPSPTYHASGGDPGGYISGTDTETIEEFGWNFNAPPSWSGDMRANYGGEITFSQRHPTADYGTVEFVSTAGSLIGISRKSSPPGNVWTTYSFTPLAGDPDWIFKYNDASGDTETATLDEFKSVLSDVNSFQVGGDLDSHQVGEETDLDTVSVAEPASPPDSDGDGVGDIEDDCPTTAGVASNNGCAAPDTTAPKTTIKSAKINQAKHSATFKFSSSEAGSTFRCKLDAKPYKSCGSPKTYRSLKVGRHKFKVRAIDKSGNADSSPAVKKFRIKR